MPSWLNCSGESLPSHPSTASSSPQRTPVQAAKTFITKSMSRPESSAHRSARHRAWNGVITLAVACCAARAGARPLARTRPRRPLRRSAGFRSSLPGVDGVAEDRDQQGAGSRGDRAGVRAAPGADARGDGVLPGLDLLEVQGPELASLELREDVALDEVLVLGAGRGLDIVEHADPHVDPVLQQDPRPGGIWGLGPGRSCQVPSICSVICWWRQRGLLRGRRRRRSGTSRPRTARRSGCQAAFFCPRLRPGLTRHCASPGPLAVLTAV